MKPNVFGTNMQILEEWIDNCNWYLDVLIFFGLLKEGFVFHSNFKEDNDKTLEFNRGDTI